MLNTGYKAIILTVNNLMAKPKINNLLKMTGNYDYTVAHG